MSNGIEKDLKPCPICNNEGHFLLNKLGVEYRQCINCKTVFCGILDNENMVGGEFEVERNTKENHERIARIDEMTNGFKENIRVLDFGCGHGMFVKDLREYGYCCDGYDAYNEDYHKLPEKESYEICVMTETIEHLSHPFLELDVIHRSLINGGLVMIETGFVEVSERDKFPIEDYFYIAPQSGHSTIFSHHSLDLLMALKGFKPQRHFNLHVRQYSKVNK